VAGSGGFRGARCARQTPMLSQLAQWHNWYRITVEQRTARRNPSKLFFLVRNSTSVNKGEFLLCHRMSPVGMSHEFFCYYYSPKINKVTKIDGFSLQKFENSPKAALRAL
jgi:hypothetical protein